MCSCELHATCWVLSWGYTLEVVGAAVNCMLRVAHAAAVCTPQVEWVVKRCTLEMEYVEMDYTLEMVGSTIAAEDYSLVIESAAAG